LRSVSAREAGLTI
jgi:hypothetical protein